MINLVIRVIIVLVIILIIISNGDYIKVHVKEEMEIDKNKSFKKK